jgi:hypothetical protein
LLHRARDTSYDQHIHNHTHTYSNNIFTHLPPLTAGFLDCAQHNGMFGSKDEFTCGEGLFNVGDQEGLGGNGGDGRITIPVTGATEDSVRTPPRCDGPYNAGEDGAAGSALITSFNQSDMLNLCKKQCSSHGFCCNSNEVRGASKHRQSSQSSARTRSYRTTRTHCVCPLFLTTSHSHFFSTHTNNHMNRRRAGSGKFRACKRACTATECRLATTNVFRTCVVVSR